VDAKKGLSRQPEHGRALTSAFLGQMMISPKIKPLISYNGMMKLLEMMQKQQQIRTSSKSPSRVTLATYNMIIKYFKKTSSK
jgi:hypothetical protein